MEIMTCDQEWSHQELYGIAYDECARACKNLTYLLDDIKLTHPNILMEIIMEELGGRNLVDIYDGFYNGKSMQESSDNIFDKWDEWMQKRIQSTLLAHKYKYYIE